MHHIPYHIDSYYTLLLFVGELGGQLGLCLGASLFTLVEFFQFLHSTVQACINQRKGHPKVAQEQSNNSSSNVTPIEIVEL